MGYEILTKRSGGQPKGKVEQAAVTLRGTAGLVTIVLNRAFLSRYRVEDKRYARLLVDQEQLRLALHLHNDEEHADEDYVVGPDGGSGRHKKKRSVSGPAPRAPRGSMIIQVGRPKPPGESQLGQQELPKHPLKQQELPQHRLRRWLGDMVPAFTKQRYEPRLDVERGHPYISLAPRFEWSMTWSGKFTKGHRAGIYRLIGAKDEVVYIGKGILADCRRRHKRLGEDGWCRMEYSVLPKEDAQFRWEKFWLEEFRRRNGCWPKYNSIRGRKDKRLE